MNPKQLILMLATLVIAVASSGLLLQTTLASQDSPEQGIPRLLDAQANAWNRGDLDDFMRGYWQSDKVLFLGASGVIRGWQAVLERYHRSYPDRTAMGHLTFSKLEVFPLSKDAAYAIGQWRVDREKDHPGGVFTLVFRRLPAGWRIVLDHTSLVPPESPAAENRAGEAAETLSVMQP